MKVLVSSRTLNNALCLPKLLLHFQWKQLSSPLSHPPLQLILIASIFFYPTGYYTSIYKSTHTEIISDTAYEKLKALLVIFFVFSTI